MGTSVSSESIVVLEVPEDYRAGARLDVYIARLAENASRTTIQRGIRNGLVEVNGRAVTKPSVTAQAGDVIRCRLPLPPPTTIVAEALPFEIIYEDDRLIVVNKAAGMPVHPGPGHRSGTLVNALLHHVGCPKVCPDLPAPVGLSTAHSARGTVRPGIVHRLDKDTTGLIVVAKDDETHRKIACQFHRRTVRRTYLAILWGKPEPPAGRIDAPIGRDSRDRKKMAVVLGGKRAVTRYETVETLRHTSLVRCRLETGRTHQIRVHVRHVGHPVVGDKTYRGQELRAGPRTSHRRAFFGNLFQVMPRQALHAETLGFVHPGTGVLAEFTCDLPADMQHVLNQLRRIEGG